MGGSSGRPDRRGTFTAEVLDHARAPDGRWFVIRAEAVWSFMGRYLFVMTGPWRVRVRRAEDDPVGRSLLKEKVPDRRAALSRLDALVAGIRAGTWDPERA